jgi:hypothetical protein
VCKSCNALTRTAESSLFDSDPEDEEGTFALLIVPLSPGADAPPTLASHRAVAPSSADDEGGLADRHSALHGRPTCSSINCHYFVPFLGLACDVLALLARLRQGGDTSAMHQHLAGLLGHAGGGRFSGLLDSLRATGRDQVQEGALNELAQVCVCVCGCIGVFRAIPCGWRSF